MEDKLNFIINQRHKIETEYYKLKYIEKINCDINNVVRFNEELKHQITELNENNKNIDNKISNIKKQFYLQNLYISDKMIGKLIEEYDDGIYGIINYIPQDPTYNNLEKYLKLNKTEFHNKPAQLKKLINNYQLEPTIIDESYGFLFMYELLDSNVKKLNKVFLLKNAHLINNITSINQDLLNETEISDNNLDDNTESTIESTIESEIKSEANSEIKPEKDEIITKIYKFDTKIILQEIIFESEYNTHNSDVENNNEIYIDDNLNDNLNDILNDNLNNNLNDDLNDTNTNINTKYRKLQKEKMHIKKQIKIKMEILSKIKSLTGMIIKYDKCIKEDITSINVKKILDNFSFIQTLTKRIIDPKEQILDTNCLIVYDFSEKISSIKISARLELLEYEIMIEKYFNESLEQLVTDIIAPYVIDDRFQPYLMVLIEILMRIFIDEHLQYKSYCLAKNLIEYFDFSAILYEPQTNTLGLRHRHWNKLLELGDKKKIISSLLMLMIYKTKT